MFGRSATTQTNLDKIEEGLLNVSKCPKRSEHDAKHVRERWGMSKQNIVLDLVLILDIVLGRGLSHVRVIRLVLGAVLALVVVSRQVTRQAT